MSAIVDGRTYTGTQIRVQGTDVYVDNVLASASAATASTSSTAGSSSEPKITPKVLINGRVGDNVNISSDAQITATAIGRNCTITSEHSGFEGTVVGDGCTIKVRDEISVGAVGTACQLTSSNYGLKARGIGARTVIDVRDAIQVLDIGDFCTLTSKMYGLKANNIGQHVTVNVRETIDVDNVGSDSVLTSTHYGMKAKVVADRVIIKVRDAVSLNSVGKGCIVTSQQYGVDVTDTVGDGSIIQVRDGVSIGGAGDRVQITSNQDKVKITGPAGDNVTISARDSIRLRDIGDNARITSSQDEVMVTGNIGVNGFISARDDIDINGTCPNPASLTFNTRGKITRPKQAATPVAAPKPSAPPLTIDSDEANYQRDLALAIAASKMSPPATTSTSCAPLEGATASTSSTAATSTTTTSTEAKSIIASVSKTGMFKPKVAVASLDAEIPPAYTCPISEEIMEDPVILTLDGRSYEREKITEWLKTKKQSPFNRAEMKPGQTIDEVLIPNRNLQEAIEAFRADNPSLFESSKIATAA